MKIMIRIIRDRRAHRKVSILRTIKATSIRFLSMFVVCLLLLLSRQGSASEFELVSYTAYTSLHWLKEAGVPEAREYAKATGKTKLIATESIKPYDTIKLPNLLYHEMRYSAINRYVEKNGYKNVMDVACGFSPRGLYMARHGIRFIGAEFDAVVTNGNNYLKKCLSGQELALASYEPVDATDSVSMLSAVSDTEGPICIVMDGLMMYLDRQQQAQALQSIKAILKKHGGCYVTVDFTARDCVMDASRVVYGEKDAHKVYLESAKVYEEIAEADFEKTFFPTTDEAQRFIEEQGLKVKRVPLFTSPIKLCSQKGLDKNQLSRLDALKSKDFLWVITLDEKESAK